MGFAAAQGDQVTLLNVYNSYLRHQRDARWMEEHRINYRGLSRATEIRRQLQAYMRRFNIETASSSSSDVDKICRSIASGFFCNTAKLEMSGEYRAVRSGQRLIAPVLCGVQVPTAMDCVPRGGVHNQGILSRRHKHRSDVDD